jgi:uncharacterized protein with PhoU and TrkA domain
MDDVETIEEISDEMTEERKTLKDILIEMKNLSETTTDLAYSAVLLNSRELAEEVVEMEEEMDKLRIEAEIKAMLASRNTEDAEDMVAMLHIAHAAENMSDSAKNIVEVVLRGEGDHPVLQGMVSEAEETTTKVAVEKNSILDNKSLNELRLGTNTGMFIIAIKRKKRWFYRPPKNRKLRQDDLLIAVGPREGVETLRGLADGSIRELE